MNIYQALTILYRKIVDGETLPTIKNGPYTVSMTKLSDMEAAAYIRIDEEPVIEFVVVGTLSDIIRHTMDTIAAAYKHDVALQHASGILELFSKLMKQIEQH